jgi:hypothetical protein
MRARRQIGGRLPLRNPQTSIHWRKWITWDRLVDDRDRRMHVSTVMEGDCASTWDARAKCSARVIAASTREERRASGG